MSPINKSKGKLPLPPMNYHALAICPHELPNITPTPSNYLTLTNRPLPLVSSVEISSQRYTCHFKPFFFHFCPPFHRTKFLYPKYPQHHFLLSFMPTPPAGFLLFLFFLFIFIFIFFSISFFLLFRVQNN
jgi:hypothetical protein